MVFIATISVKMTEQSMVLLTGDRDMKAVWRIIIRFTLMAALTENGLKMDIPKERAMLSSIIILL